MAALDRLSLVLVFVFAALALHEHVTFRGWIGLGLVVAGTFLIVAQQSAAG